MGYESVRLRPGINVQFTPALNEGGWSDCSFIRFKDGLPQKLGGWDYYYPNAIGSPIRWLHAWQDLNEIGYLAVGAEASLQYISDGSIVDISPQTRSSSAPVDFSTLDGTPDVTIVDVGSSLSIYDAVFFETPISVGGLILSGTYPVVTALGSDSYVIDAGANATSTVTSGGDLPTFTTTTGQPVVSVEFPDNGYIVGQVVYFGVPTTVGGLTIQGSYTITAIIDADNFEISAGTPATSDDSEVMNGDEAAFLYYISIGPPATGVGYGLGGYGEGGYGLGIPSPYVPGTPITATNWSFDNWGETLLACPFGGGIYQWRPRSVLSNAQIIPQAPNLNGGIFIAMPQQILVAWASSEEGAQDPLLVRWSGVSDYSLWTAAPDNQAGAYRIPRGSRIVGGMQAPNQALIWTDQAVWAMNYIGSELAFGFNEIGTGCGLVGQHAAGRIGANVVWMSSGNFFILSSTGPAPIPCSVWDRVFQNINSAALDKVICAPNSEFNEVSWYYPSSGSADVDQYVKFNLLEGTWDYGSLQRTAWIDQSVLGPPIGADAQGFVYQHEISQNANGAPLPNYIESGWFMLTEGDPLVFIDMLLPDFKYGFYPGSGNADVEVTVFTADYPSNTPAVHGPFTMTQATAFLSMRARARMAKVRLASNDLNSFWRLGNLRYRAAPAGRR